MFALIDCNNFYASCERVFNPKLAGKPVVVLSSNDGCIIARSNEAKAAGIPMGAPVYKYQDLIKRHKVNVFSANFALYGDMSNRVMQVIKANADKFHIYSIDEAFIEFDKSKYVDIEKFCRKLRLEILRATGIPVSIGIAPTKTLAKLANYFCKKNPELKGVFDIGIVDDIDEVLKTVEVGNIWGIGYRLRETLNKHGIYNIHQFKYANEMWVHKALSVSVLKTQTEIKGISCISLETNSNSHKSIISSKSFGRHVETIEELREAVSTYATRASEKLRENKAITTYVHVYIKTNKHRKDFKQYYNYATRCLSSPSSYTPEIISAALSGLEEIFIAGYKYKKAMVVLSGILPEDHNQINLFDTNENFAKKQKLMVAVDAINKRSNTHIQFASNGIQKKWWMRQSQRTPRYTTSWEEILKVRL